MATSDGYMNKETGEWIEKTEWHNIKTFNERICKIVSERVKKGSKVYLEGAMKTEKFVKDGVERFSTCVEIPIFGGEFVCVDKKEVAAQAKPAASSNPQSNDDLGDEIRW